MPPADLGRTSDEALADAAQRGDVRALDELIARHEAKVLRVLGFLGVVAQEREDVAQEIFIRVFRHLASFRRGRSFGGWLYRVTVNAAHDHRKGRERAEREVGDGALPLEPAAAGSGPAERLDRRDLRRALVEALERLSPRERAVFVLKEIEGLETVEVARALGVTAITVRRHLGRARRRLQKLLGSASAPSAFSVERIAPGGSSHG